jgi:hypothetical protein
MIQQIGEPIALHYEACVIGELHELGELHENYMGGACGIVGGTGDSEAGSWDRWSIPSI